MKNLIVLFALTLTFASCSGRKHVYLHTGWYRVTEQSNGVARTLNKVGRLYRLEAEPIIGVGNMASVKLLHEDSVTKVYAPTMIISHDPKGTEVLKAATAPPFGQSIALVINNQLIKVATIQGQILTGVVFISFNDYTMSELEGLKAAIDTKQ
jgi:hypothetical protein